MRRGRQTRGLKSLQNVSFWHWWFFLQRTSSFIHCECVWIWHEAPKIRPLICSSSKFVGLVPKPYPTRIFGEKFSQVQKKVCIPKTYPTPRIFASEKKTRKRFFFCLGNRGRKSIVGMTWSTEWIAFWVGSTTMGLSWRAGVAGEDYCIFFH